MGQDKELFVFVLGMSIELSATLEEILDKRSQYGRPSVDESAMLRRCCQLAQSVERSLKETTMGGSAT